MVRIIKAFTKTKGITTMKEIINGHEIEIKSELSPEIIDFLIESHKSIFSKEFHFNPIFFEMVEKTITEFGKEFNPEKDFTLIAYVDGEKMGSISGIGREKGNVQLRFYFLHEGARGMKLGKKLFVAAMDKCKEMGYNHIFFHTFNKLEVARAMYEKLGFVITGSESTEEITQGAVEEIWEKDI